MNSQVSYYGGNLLDFSKVILNIQSLLDGAVLIEVHTDKAKGTSKENSRLLRTHVLLSAYRENKTVTPVQFEIKQYVDNNNRLYLAVALTKIEADVMGDTAPKSGERTRLLPASNETGVMGDTILENQASTRLLPVSNISIPQLIEKINPKDKNFFKYIPDEFLHQDQLDAKKTALERESKKYAKKTDEIVTQEDVTSDVAQQYAPSSKISLSQLFQKVNKKDEAFLKYVPEKFFVKENEYEKIAAQISSLDKQLYYLRNEPKNVEKQLKAARKKFGRSFSALVSSSIFLALVALGFKWLYRCL